MPKDDDFEVFKSNMLIIDAFLMLDDCAWQYSGMGDLIGLDYKAADVIWTRSGVELKPDQFKGLMLFAKLVSSEIRKRKK